MVVVPLDALLSFTMLDSVHMPAMVSAVNRRHTFKYWTNKNVDVQQLVEAGFYTIPLKNLDLTICFSCGLCLHKWEVGDIPVKEHFSRRPYCQYLLCAKTYGGEFDETKVGRDETGHHISSPVVGESRPHNSSYVAGETGPHTSLPPVTSETLLHKCKSRSCCTAGRYNSPHDVGETGPHNSSLNLPSFDGEIEISTSSSSSSSEDETDSLTFRGNFE